MTMLRSGAPADPLQRRRVAADAEVGRIDDGPAAIFDEMLRAPRSRPSRRAAPQLSRLRNGFIRKSPIIEMSSGLSAMAISEPQQGRFHQLEASSRICSCISVTPIASTGIGPSTVRTMPGLNADPRLRHVAPLPFFSRSVALSGTGGSSARSRSE